MAGFSDILSFLTGANDHTIQNQQMMEQTANTALMAYEGIEPFTLGTNETPDTRRRHRREIYTLWEQMLRSSFISEAVGIHAAAALGGHETRSLQVFLVPATRLRNQDGAAAKALRDKVEARRAILEAQANLYITKLVHDAVGYGDSYARIYGEKGTGIVDVLSNEYTHPPLIQSFEQGNKTVAYHILDPSNWKATITKLNGIQMLRFKIPRVTNIPQHELVRDSSYIKLLQADKQEDMPILPGKVGGSFLYEVEKPWKDVNLALATMNSQQIADAVNQMFISMNMSGMPPAQQKRYKSAFEGMIKNHEKFVKSALAGGEAIWNTKFHVVPSWDEKQVLNPLGDIRGQRASPINTETFMINARLLMGGLGLDVSLVGWADMLAGGLGDGAAFHTSAQIMRRSLRIRQGATDFLNQLAHLDWGYAYGEQFSSQNDFPWEWQFYSDQSAAATEAITNKQARMNTMTLVAQSLAMIKELNLNEENTTKLLEDTGGFDYEVANLIAKDLKAQADAERNQTQEGSDG